jgi:hypothetical protein
MLQAGVNKDEFAGEEQPCENRAVSSTISENAVKSSARRSCTMAAILA